MIVEPKTKEMPKTKELPKTKETPKVKEVTGTTPATIVVTLPADAKLSIDGNHDDLHQRPSHLHHPRSGRQQPVRLHAAG